MSDNKVSCDDCKHNSYRYADGWVFKDFSGSLCGPPSKRELSVVQDPKIAIYWTYQECAKNAKGLKFLNLIGDCKGFEAQK